MSMITRQEAARMLFGADRKLHRMLQYWAGTAIMYTIVIGMLFGPAALAGQPQARAICLYVAAGVAVFYPLVRIGARIGLAPTILAGLQGIPKSQYEAASIDGASAWRQFIHITLPGIAPVLATAGLLRVIWVANSMDVIFVMTGGGPGYATHTLPLYAFIKARQNLDFGYGTSIAVTFTILLGAFVVLYLARTMREVER